MDQIWKEMYEAAKAVQNGRKISDYVTAGEVSAAIYSASGKIYTGVCIDTCSTLGICAEILMNFRSQRNANCMQCCSRNVRQQVWNGEVM